MNFIRILKCIKYGLIITSIIALTVNPIMACYWTLLAIFLSLELNNR